MKFQLPLFVLVATSNALKLPIHRVQPSAKKIDSSKKDVLELWTSSSWFLVDVNVSSSTISAYLTFFYSDLLVIPEDVQCMDPDYLYQNFTEDSSAYYCSYNGAVDTDDFTIDTDLPSHAITFEDEDIRHIYYAKANVSVGSFDDDIIQLEDFTFGVLNTTFFGFNFLGIGLPDGQFSNVRDFDKDDYFERSLGVEMIPMFDRKRSDGKTYDNFLASLKSSGQIDKEKVSLYWDEYDYGILLVGEDEEDAYEGLMNTVPLVNSVSSLGYDNPAFLASTAEELYFDGVKGDTGKLNCYIIPESSAIFLPFSVFAAVNRTVDGTYEIDEQNYISYDCDTNISGLTFTVGFGDGANLTFSLEDLVSLDSLGDSCYLNIYRTNSGMGLGYPALKNYYVSFDYEDQTFLFASRRTLVELEDDDSEFGGMDSESSSSSSKMSSTKTSTTRTSSSKTSSSSSSARTSSSSTDTEGSESTGTTEEESESTETTLEEPESTETTQEDSSESTSSESPSESSSTSSELGLVLTPSSFMALLFALFAFVV